MVRHENPLVSYVAGSEEVGLAEVALCSNESCCFLVVLINKGLISHATATSNTNRSCFPV